MNTAYLKADSAEYVGAAIDRAANHIGCNAEVMPLTPATNAVVIYQGEAGNILYRCALDVRRDRDGFMIRMSPLPDDFEWQIPLLPSEANRFLSQLIRA